MRLLASLLYLRHQKYLNDRSRKLIAFTGTAGKTTARNYLEYLFEKQSVTCISPKLGYTNEFGVVSAMLDENFQGLSLSIFKLLGLFVRIPKKVEAWVLAEMGSDIYADIPWYLTRFTPRILCVTTIDNEEWARPIEKLNEERALLMRKVTSEGGVVIGQEKHTMQHNQLLGPQNEALSLALEVARVCGCGFDEIDVSELPSLSLRLDQFTLPSGAHVITDTYKAIPLCTKWLLAHGLSFPARKRILVLSSMQPLWINVNEHWSKIHALAIRYDQVYFIGEENDAENFTSRVKHTRVFAREDFQYISDEIKSTAGADDLVIVKGAFRYRLDQLQLKFISQT